MKHHAQCQCGQLTITSTADPDHVVACNCKACQHRTGAAFGVGLYIPKAHLTIAGEYNNWSRSSDSGRALTFHFCPTCGTNLFWTFEMRPDHMGIAYGCLTTPAPVPERAIWAEAKHDWVEFPADWPVHATGSPGT